MEQRIIKLSVKNEYILGEGVVIGAAGSHDEVLLELDFRASPVWHGTTKKAIFYDAMYKNPATILLTTNLLAEGQTDVYYVPVPQAAKTAAGDCFLTVEGTVVEGSGENAKETVRVTTREARFPVLPNKRYLNETPITPTQAEQLQAEIDDIKSTVSEAKDSADAAEGCLDHVGLLFGLFQPFHLAVCLIAHVADGFLYLYYMIHIVHIDRCFLIYKIIVRFSFFIGRLTRNRLFLEHLF